MPQQSALIIFIKNAVLGKVKTRIAQDLGDEKALKIYETLTEITRSITDQLTGEKVLFYSDFIDYNDAWDNTLYDKQLQVGNDLGERMLNAFTYTLSKENIKKASIIGSDCPDISLWHLTKSFYALDTHEIVIGPANDGGYYLLGMRKPYPSIFQNKAWSSNSVLKSTCEELLASRIPYYLLPYLTDTDTIHDFSPAFEQLLIQKGILTKNELNQ